MSESNEAVRTANGLLLAYAQEDAEAFWLLLKDRTALEIGLASIHLAASAKHALEHIAEIRGLDLVDVLQSDAFRHAKEEERD